MGGKRRRAGGSAGTPRRSRCRPRSASAITREEDGPSIGRWRGRPWVWKALRLGMSIRVQAAAVRLVLGLPHQLDVNPAPAASYLPIGGRLKPCRQRGGRAAGSRSGWSDVGQITTPRHVSAPGMLTWNVVPTPTVLSAQMRPLWASMIPLQIVSPSPAPARAARSVRQKRSKI